MKSILFRDVAYIVVAPDNEYILSNVKTFFKNLSNTYSILKLGKHVPVTKVRIVEKNIISFYDVMCAILRLVDILNNWSID